MRVFFSLSTAWRRIVGLCVSIEPCRVIFIHIERPRFLFFPPTDPYGGQLSRLILMRAKLTETLPRHLAVYGLLDTTVKIVPNLHGRLKLMA